MRALLGTGLLVIGLGLAGSQAKPRPSLAPFAGSYTGTASSRAAGGGVISGGATLTFTGRPARMRGTFLYTGFLNSGGVARSVVQVLNISNLGVAQGRVTLDGVVGRGRGTVKLHRHRMATAIAYAIGGPDGTVIQLTGQITFADRRVKWVSKVSSNDYDGRLVVVGRR